jgi:hypothetical protein
MFEFVPSGYGALLPTAPDTITLKRWHHVAATYDGLKMRHTLMAKKRMGKQLNQTELIMIRLTILALEDFRIMMRIFVGVE